jgi:hypothetical protein
MVHDRFLSFERTDGPRVRNVDVLNIVVVTIRREIPSYYAFSSGWFLPTST